MTDEAPSLDALGHKHRTDKASYGHGYLAFYERFFRPMRDLIRNLLQQARPVSH
jgi:hypothetical protein